jgi:hypothetical protein
MRKRISFLFSACLLAVSSVLAQTGDFKFQEESFDFGTVSEGVQAEHEFSFTNTGTTPIVISNVRASCGCTTPDWTKDPIPPGGKGTIKASFNSQGRPGVFNKSITVTSNATESQKVLYIKGVVDQVQPKPEFTAEELKKSAALEVEKTTTHNFGKVERGQKVNKEFKVKNTGKTALTIQKVQSACNCITHKLTPETLEPGKSGKLEIIYNPYQDGLNKDVLTIFTNDLNKPQTPIVLIADVVENLNQQSPVKENKEVPFK